MAKNRWFGLTFGKDEDAPKDTLRSFVPPESDEGVREISYLSFGGMNAYTIDVDGSIRTENELINKYRELAQMADIDLAIEDITSESIVTDEKELPVKLDLENLEITDKTKEMIHDEFKVILNLLDFKLKGTDIFKRWYIDGRIYYHVLYDLKNPTEGLKELRFIDPRKIKKVRETPPIAPIATNDQRVIERTLPRLEEFNEYYVYSDSFYTGMTTNNPNTVFGSNKNDTKIDGLRINTDAIATSNSGIVDARTGVVLSYLHKAIRPANQLKLLEDALVIYRLSRAPEKRVFYIDTADLPRNRAEQSIKQIMDRFKNKLVYNSETGDIKGQSHMMTMLEDFYIPRRNGSNATQIDTLEGGQNLGKIEDVEYFLKKLMKALNVPYSRISPEDGAMPAGLGRSSETTKEEIKYQKFISRLRNRFSMLFECLLRQQLLLKGIITDEDWEEVRKDIQYDFLRDNFFSEMKEAEILRERLATLAMVEVYDGKYFTKKQILKDILRYNDDQIRELADYAEEIEKAKAQALKNLPKDKETGLPITPPEIQAPGNIGLDPDGQEDPNLNPDTQAMFGQPGSQDNGPEPEQDQNIPNNKTIVSEYVDAADRASARALNESLSRLFDNFTNIK